MSILPKLISEFNAILMKMSIGNVLNFETNILMFIGRPNV